MDDSNRREALANFRSITGIEEERAKFLMESSDYNIERALTNYYDYPEQETRDTSDIVEEIPPIRSQQPPLSQIASSLTEKTYMKPVKPSGNVRTLSTIQNQDHDSESSNEEEGQAFYAGGSEFSGQQVLGPPRRRRADIVTDMFRSVREFGAEVVESQPSNSRGYQSHVFSGTGYKLGETGNDSEVIASKKTEDKSQVEITLKFWKDGFSVNEGPLRSYEDPKNAEFLHHIKHGEVPSELLVQAEGREISFNMEDYRNSEYIRTGPKVSLFSGAGQKLGSVTPTLSSPAIVSQTAPKIDSEVLPNPVKVDNSKPTTSVQIRLADGSRLIGNFNHLHTVGDIRQFINAYNPSSRGRDYTLVSSFPRKELTDDEATIEQYGLINSVVMQRVIS